MTLEAADTGPERGRLQTLILIGHAEKQLRRRGKKAAWISPVLQIVDPATSEEDTGIY